MEIQKLYTKRRSEFGCQALYSERGPELCDSIMPDKVIQKQFMLRNPIHQQTQNAPSFANHEVNTIRSEVTKSGVNHSEGGWPKDVNILDPEATQRYRRKIEKDEDYIHCVITKTPTMEHYCLQNEAIDMYGVYYNEMTRQPPIEPSSCRVTNVYIDSELQKRPVSSISWSPDMTEFSTSYASMDIHRKPKGVLTAYIWSIDTVAAPLSTLEPPDTLIDLQYSLRDQNMFAGGLACGQVVCFDNRATQRTPIMTSPAFTSHRDLVTSVVFINTKTGTEFISGSSDGTLKWWDMRNLEEPTDEQIIDPVKQTTDEHSMVTAMGVSNIEYEPTIPTRYMVGTENGFVIGGNRKGKTPFEKLPAKFQAHNGTIKSLERNSLFMKNFLTVADWTLKIWSEDCRESCILVTPELRNRLTAACWSPTRVSLITSTMYTGQFAIWDLLQKQHEPIITQQVCSEPLMKIKAHNTGQYVACGSMEGRVYLLELSSFLTQSLKHDKVMLAAIFERESKREKLIENRLREIRLKLRQADEMSPKPSAMTIDMTLGDRDLVEATTDYMAQVRKELAAM